MTLTDLPLTLTAAGAEIDWQSDGPDTLSAVAAPRTDIFIDPAGSPPVLTAARLLGDLPTGDLQLRARVTVGFAGTFDAGVLLLWADERHWAKLCFEYAPSGEPMVVSVVNREVSDDANAFVVASDTVWLRVSRIGEVWAFHASTDGEHWQLIRIFALDTELPVRGGFEVQSPLGDGCPVRFEQIRLDRSTLTDTRDGS